MEEQEEEEIEDAVLVKTGGYKTVRERETNKKMLNTHLGGVLSLFFIFI